MEIFSAIFFLFAVLAFFVLFVATQYGQNFQNALRQGLRAWQQSRRFYAEDWGPPQPSDRPDYSTQQRKVCAPLKLEGFQFDLSETLYARPNPQAAWWMPQSEKCITTTARIHAERAPAWAQRSWRPAHPPSLAHAQMAEECLRDVHEHLDDQITIFLDAEAQPHERHEVAARLVQGVAALCLKTPQLEAWLARTEDDAGEPRPQARREAFAISLLLWFIESPQAAEVAVWGQSSESRALRHLSQLLVGPDELRWTLTHHIQEPVLRQHALRYTLGQALKVQAYGEIEQTLNRSGVVPGDLEIWARMLCEGADTRRISALTALFKRSFEDPAVMLSVGRLLEDLGAPPWALVHALACPQAQVREFSAERVIAAHGEEGLNARLFEIFDDLLGERARGFLEFPHPPILEDLSTMLRLTGNHADYGALSALTEKLRAHSQKYPESGWIQRTLANVQAHLTALEARIPQGVAGALSVLSEDRSGGLSVAASGAELSAVPED